MDVSRREFVVLGLGLLAAAGCAQHGNLAERPGPEWPGGRPRPDGATPFDPPARQASYFPQPASPQIYTPQTPQIEPPPPMHSSGGLQAIPRSQWAKADPIMKQINPMGGID